MRKFVIILMMAMAVAMTGCQMETGEDVNPVVLASVMASTPGTEAKKSNWGNTKLFYRLYPNSFADMSNAQSVINFIRAKDGSFKTRNIRGVKPTTLTHNRISYMKKLKPAQNMMGNGPEYKYVAIGRYGYEGEEYLVTYSKRYHIGDDGLIVIDEETQGQYVIVKTDND